jgi:hypothetical protein
MLDTATILDVMKKGGSLDEAAAACDMSLNEIVEQAVDLQEVESVVMKGVTLSRAWWSSYLRQNISKPLCMEAYQQLIGDMNNTVNFIKQQTGKKLNIGKLIK